jgi:hypothetical protein
MERASTDFSVLAEIGHSQIQNRPLLVCKTEFNGVGGLRTHIGIVSDVPPGTSKLRPQHCPALGPILLAAPEGHESGGNLQAVFPSMATLRYTSRVLLLGSLLVPESSWRSG